MSKRKLRTYNRLVAGDTMDVAWQAVHAGAMTWDDARAIQDSLQPDCVGCGEKHAGKITMEKLGYCPDCFRKHVAERMAARRDRP